MDENYTVGVDPVHNRAQNLLNLGVFDWFQENIQHGCTLYMGYGFCSVDYGEKNLDSVVEWVNLAGNAATLFNLDHAYLSGNNPAPSIWNMLVQEGVERSPWMWQPMRLNDHENGNKLTVMLPTPINTLLCMCLHPNLPFDVLEKYVHEANQSGMLNIHSWDGFDQYHLPISWRNVVPSKLLEG